MVLQDLGDTPPDDSGDRLSQDDPYASRTTSGPRFDSSNLPHPPIYSEAVLRRRTEQTLKFAEQKVHRPLTSPEAQALAFHLYRLEQRKAYFSYAGMAAGTWRWWATMAQNRYPFYLPKAEDVNPNKFLIFKGPNASFWRHSWRFICYTTVAGQLAKAVGFIFAQPLAARDTAADPAMSKFSDDLKNALGSNVDLRRESTAKVKAEWEDRIRQSRSASRQETPSSLEQDMSPSAGTDSWSSPSESYSDSDYSSQIQSQNQQSPPRYQQAQSRNRRPTHRSDDDDASPTGGLFQDEVQNQSTSGESSWDRLRRGAGPIPGQRASPRRIEPPHKDQKEGSTLGDSFTFADSEEDRKLAQEKAQREFDERLERERQGKDFNDERRW